MPTTPKLTGSANHWATLSVPDHREVAPGTLRTLIRASGLTVEQFLELTKK